MNDRKNKEQRVPIDATLINKLRVRSGSNAATAKYLVDAALREHLKLKQKEAKG